MPFRASLARASLSPLAVSALAVAVLAGSALAGSALAGSALAVSAVVPMPASAADAIRVVTSRLTAVGGSRESGTIAVGPARDFGTIVHLRLAHQPPGVLQPAEIRAGTCAKYGSDPHYALEPVLSGRSDTRIDVARKAFLADGGVVLVHLSRMRDDVVACGPVG